MSDERFKVDYEVGVLDTKTNEIICDTVNAEEVVGLLNEQQATIQSLKEENEQLKHWNKCLAEKRHNEKESNENSIKKLIGKIDFLERIIDGDL